MNVKRISKKKVLLFTFSYISTYLSTIYFFLRHCANLNHRREIRNGRGAGKHRRVNLLKSPFHPSLWRILQRYSSQRKLPGGQSSQSHHSHYALASPRLPNPSNLSRHILSLSNLAASPYVSPDTRLASPNATRVATAQ